MKEFFKILKRFVPPYKRSLILSLIFTLFSAILNVFSFMVIIPILQILFKINDTSGVEFIEWSAMDSSNAKDVLFNNATWYLNSLSEEHGASMVMLLLGFFLIFMTLLKTGCYFGSSAAIIPMRTGIVRDMRTQLYNKIVTLPIGFFSKQRKGDIMARMIGDVGEVENSIATSLDMLIKNPMFILIYMTTLFYISWELTLFTLCVVPSLGWVMGAIGRKLKASSSVAQQKLGETTSQMEETLGGLRIIKAFIAEKKMSVRFRKCSDELRSATMRVAMRQASAHPVSETLGTVLIVIVLWFGGTLILGENSPISAASFIYYLTILYSVINPLKDLSKASYNIPRGLASMERVDAILNAENPITDGAKGIEIPEMKEGIEFKNLTFSYDGERDVLKNINLKIPKGKTVALVGQSGSGKSTMVDLIPRYYDVENGCITIDGVNVKDMKVKSLRGLIGNVNQEAILSMIVSTIT